MEKHLFTNIERKRKVGLTQICLEKLLEKNETPANLPDILQAPTTRSRNDTLSSFSSLYYTASEDSIDEVNLNRNNSFDVGRKDSHFYTGINCLQNDNLSLIFSEIEEIDITEDEKKTERSKTNLPIIQNYLDLGEKLLYPCF